MKKAIKGWGILPIIACITMLSACQYSPVSSSGYKHDPSSQVKPPKVMVNPTMVNPNIPVP